MEVQHIIEWLFVFGLLIGIYFIVPASITWLVFEVQANPTVEPVDAELQSVLRDVIDGNAQTIAALEQLGFAHEATLSLPHLATRFEIALITQLFCNRLSKETASLSAVVRKRGRQWSIQSQTLEFNSRSCDGFDIETSNTPVNYPFPSPRHTLRTEIKWIDDLIELHRIHQAITSRLLRDEPREFQLDSVYNRNAPAWLAAELRAYFDSAQQDDYLRLTPNGERFRTTILGACLMSWLHLPPFNYFVARARERRVKELLERLGVVS